MNGRRRRIPTEPEFVIEDGLVRRRQTTSAVLRRKGESDIPGRSEGAMPATQGLHSLISVVGQSGGGVAAEPCPQLGPKDRFLVRVEVVHQVGSAIRRLRAIAANCVSSSPRTSRLSRDRRRRAWAKCSHVMATPPNICTLISPTSRPAEEQNAFAC